VNAIGLLAGGWWLVAVSASTPPFPLALPLPSRRYRPRPMALHQIHYSSAPIGMQSTMLAVVPQRAGPLPVIYQLHGHSDDHSIWLRRTTIELHAERIGAIVVMLFGERSFYHDDVAGHRCWEQHVLKSVELIDATFRTVADRRGRAVGGLSMGGYGALALALRHPRIFGSAVSHSGAVDVVGLLAECKPGDVLGDDMRRVFGERIPAEADPFKLALRAKPLPQLHIDCGSEDFLLPGNRKLHAHLERRGIPHVYREYPGGHSWEYWQARLPESFDFHAAWFAAGGTRKRG
jgi:S-formylglutathione hydrolase FrmB